MNSTLDEVRLEQVAERLEYLVTELERQRSAQERLTELIHDLAPISRQAMDSLGSRLSALEARGYPAFARAGLAVIDEVVTAFDERDVEALGDNIVLILQTVREMTRPEVMRMLQRTVHEVSEVEEPIEPPSLLSLFRQLNLPQTRRGLFRLMALLRSMGENPSTATERRDSR